MSQIEDYNPGKPLRMLQELFYPFEVKAELKVFWDKGLYSKGYINITNSSAIQISKYKVVGHVNP